MKEEKDRKTKVTITLPGQEPFVFEVAMADFEETVKDKVIVAKKDGVVILTFEQL